jgi:hypothetical protein
VSGFDTLTKDSKAQDYWFRRLIAYIIDGVIVFIPLWIIGDLIAFSYFFLGGFGFYSVYGFLSQVSVRPDEQVRKGQVGAQPALGRLEIRRVIVSAAAEAFAVRIGARLHTTLTSQSPNHIRCL